MPHWLTAAFGRYGYLVLFIGVFLENLGIPVPGETALLAAGFFAKQHVLRLAIVIPCAMVAAILGDNFGYWIGRRGGRGFVEHYGKFVGLSAKRLDAVDAYFRKHGPRTIFFARFISGIRVFAAIFAGISEIPWTRFLLFNTAGAIVWSTTIALLGYVFGQSWKLLEHWVGRGGLFLVAVVVCAILLATLRRHRGRIATAIENRLPGSMTVRELCFVLATLVTVGLFGKIAEDVVTREATPFDVAFAHALTHVAWSGMRPLMLFFNTLGSGPVIIGTVVVGLLWCIRNGDRAGRNSLLALAIVTQVLDAVLKLSFQVARPSPLQAHTNLYTASFPSGHAMNAVAIYGLIAVLIARHQRGRGPIAAAVVTLIALAIGIARVYLQLHWATDVLAGYTAGLLLLIGVVFFIERADETQGQNVHDTRPATDRGAEM